VRACPSINESLEYGHWCGFHVSALRKPVKGLTEPNSFSREKEGGSGKRNPNVETWLTEQKKYDLRR
jgi:hypothetical protein